MEENKTAAAAEAKQQSWQDKAEDKLDELKANASVWADKAEDKLEELKDKAEDKFEELRDKAEELAGDLKEKATNLWEKVVDQFDGDEEPKKEEESK